MPEKLKFDLPKFQSSIIKVIGIGGGGTNAVNHMYNQGIKGVDFIVCNTDAQSLETSPVPTKVQLGASLTEGRGAGSIPRQGRDAALENVEDVRAILEHNTKMLFVTAGMGGGTGTGAAPVIAAVARELGILTVGIVTIPFSFEGRKRLQQAEEGIRELRKEVDTLLVICNDKLRELYGDLSLSKAFGKADDILTTAAKGIAEIITVTGYINVDFEDINTVMRNSGVAIMGSGSAEGENRAAKAVEEALASPLLNDNDIYGAENVLLYITSGKEEISMDEVSGITEYILEKSGMSANIIWGNGYDEHLGNKISVTLVATGFKKDENGQPRKEEKPKVLVGSLDDVKTEEKPETPMPVVETEEATIQIEVVSAPKNEIHLIVNEDVEIPVFQDVSKDPAYQPLIPDLEEEVRPRSTQEITEPVMMIRPAREEEKKEKTAATPVSSGASEKEIEQAGQGLRSRDRIKRLKDLSYQLKGIHDIESLEREPAYLRRQVQLSDPPHSSESQISRLSLTDKDGERNGSELRANNSYLHDNVD
ncbi:MAG: cell division protein FtsZ [Lentimicrobiaceae bacterium]|nr:cell division protein FtsZ [Lentimicrobiaceae bacterium]